MAMLKLAYPLKLVLRPCTLLPRILLLVHTLLASLHLTYLGDQQLDYQYPPLILAFQTQVVVEAATRVVVVKDEQGSLDFQPVHSAYSNLTQVDSHLKAGFLMQQTDHHLRLFRIIMHCMLISIYQSSSMRPDRTIENCFRLTTVVESIWVIQH